MMYEKIALKGVWTLLSMAEVDGHLAGSTAAQSRVRTRLKFTTTISPQEPPTVDTVHFFEFPDYESDQVFFLAPFEKGTTYEDRSYVWVMPDADTSFVCHVPVGA